MADLEEYREDTKETIQTTLEASDLPPVLLVGSGLSIRYFSGPNWDHLLEELCDLCPLVEYDYGHYRQRQSEEEIGEFLSEKFSKWAWEVRGEEFEPELFDQSMPSDIFLKFKVSEILTQITPDTPSHLEDDIVDGDLSADEARAELEFLKEIQPSSIITTNYDTFLENTFNEEVGEDDIGYQVIVGQQILQDQHRHLGEILKIHGCVSSPDSIILTKSDYEDFNNRQRYLSSKLLTYLVEHPVLILGYQAGDPNVRQIFSWMKQVLPEKGDFADDIFYVTYVEDMDSRDILPREKDIRIENGKDITVNQIAAHNFGWIFESFAHQSGVKIPIGPARNFVENAYNLVSSQDPSAEVVDYTRLEEIARDEEELAKVLGVAVEEVPPIEFDHHLRPTELAEELGWQHHVPLNLLIDELAESEGFDIREFNNRYHIAFFEEGGVTPRRYSQEARELLSAFKNGEDYQIAIPEERIPD